MELVLSSGGALGKVLFENHIIQYLGKISYSIYLVHAIVLNHIPKSLGDFGVFAVGLFVTVVISSITYYVIEKPFIALGKT